MDVFETYSYLCVGFVGLILSTTMLVHWVKTKDIARPPNDLLAAVCFGEMLLCVHWVFAGLRTNFVTTAATDESLMCTVTLIISTLGISICTWYNFAFMVYVMFKFRSSIRKSFVPFSSLHLVAVIMVVVLFFTQRKKEGNGKNGICCIRQDKPAVYVSMALILVGVIFAAFTNWKISSLLSTRLKGESVYSFKKDFIHFYHKYIYSYCLLSLCALFAMLIDAFIPDNRRENPLAVRLLFSLGKVFESCQLLMPIVMFFIRLEAFLQSKEHPSVKPSPSNPDSSKPSAALDVDVMHELMITSEDSENMDWFEFMPVLIKESYTRTFLVCLSNFYSETLKSITILKDEAIDMQELSQEVVRVKLVASEVMFEQGISGSMVNCMLTILCPTIFKAVIGNRAVDFERSLDPLLNGLAIKKAGEGGGKSGQLFMFSHDNKIVLKTIKHKEYEILKKTLSSYGKHCLRNPQSLLCQLYGAFKIDVENTKKSIYLIAMENLFESAAGSIVRKYDLKGSTYGRRSKQNYDEFLGDRLQSSFEELKDLDFQEIEHRIELVCKQERQVLIHQLIADSLFLRDMGLIDYSLVIAAVDRSTCNMQALADLPKHAALRLIHSDDPHLIFLIGIVDYLTEYTFAKRMETLGLKVKTCNKNVNSSCQPPDTYAKRFYEYMQEVFR